MIEESSYHNFCQLINNVLLLDKALIISFFIEKRNIELKTRSNIGGGLKHALHNTRVCYKYDQKSNILIRPKLGEKQ